MRVQAVGPERRGTGEIAADFRPDLQVFEWVPVQAAGHLRVVCVYAGPGPLHIVEPLATNVDVEIRRQMKETDRIKTIPRARTDRSVRVPAHVVLNNLCEPRAPVLLDAQFHHADKITGKPRGGEDGVRTDIDRSSQTRPPLFLQPVVDLTDVANRARAALNEKGVGTQGHSVPDIEPVGAVQVRQPAGKGTVLRVEELVIAGVEGSIRG